MMLSEHFTLEELTASEVAARAGIDNTPSAETMRNLLRLATGLELVRAALGNNPIHVTSGYRFHTMELSEISDRINRATGRFEREAVEAAMLRQDDTPRETPPVLARSFQSVSFTSDFEKHITKGE